MADTPSEAAPRLLRALGPWTAMAVVIGTVIGSGIFKKPQTVAENVPYFGLAALVWILGGLLAFLGALALAEVAVLYPKAGGNYVFLREGYGRLFGFLFGWVEFWMIRGGSLAALATVFTEALRDVLRQVLVLAPEAEPLAFWEQRGLTVAIILGLALVNVRGVKWGGVLQLFITSVKVASLIGILALPFAVAVLAPSTSEVPRPQTELLQPLWPASWDAIPWTGFGAALVGVLFAYHGWMNVAPVAEEIRQPQRNLPLSLLGGTSVVIFLYLGANLAYYLILPAPEMAAAKDTAVATVFFRALLGPSGVVAATAAVMCSTFGALNGNLLVGPRLLYAMGEDGLAPRVLGEVHARYRTPAVAIVVMAGWASVLVLAGAALTQYRLPTVEVGGYILDINVPAGKALFDILTDFAMFGAVVFETLAVATIFVFRWRCPDAERPYRCLGYPVVPLLYVVIMALVLRNMFRVQQTEALTGVAFIAVGAVVYFLAGYRTVREKPAVE